MNYYFCPGRSMGAVTRGIQILEALGGGTILCPAAFAWAPQAQGLRAVRCGWKDLPAGDVAIFDGKPPAGIELFLSLRARRYQVLDGAPSAAALLYAPLCEAVFSAADLGPGAVRVPALVPAPDLGRAEAWWGSERPRILVVQAGRGPGEALALTAAVARAGYAPRLCAPWWANARYWPASDLIATADVVVTAGGAQTRAEIEAAGAGSVMMSLGPGAGRLPDFQAEIAAILEHPRLRAMTAERRLRGGGAAIIARHIQDEAS